jgi:D-sedoheptulose 7-phosphate isomerase
MTSLARRIADATSAADYAARYVAYLRDLMTRLDFEAVGRLTAVLDHARRDGRTVFFLGNGGSAATASHWANDLALGARGDGMMPFRTVSLTDNAAIVTAIANDVGYAEVFVRQLEGLLRPGDVVVAISASGNSPNVIRAVEYARARGAVTVGLTGFDGGRLKALCDVSVHVPTPSGEYGPVEDLHLMLDHLVTGYLRGHVGAHETASAARQE